MRQSTATRNRGPKRPITTAIAFTAACLLGANTRASLIDDAVVFYDMEGSG